jgi:hypothetical protein
VNYSDYLGWVKTRKPLRFNLAASGVMNYSLADLGAGIDDIELTGPGLNGYEPLQEALARKCGVLPDCVVRAAGASMANYLAMASLAGPGDEVLIEHPAYDPLLAVARNLGATVTRFKRAFEDGFRIRPGEVARSVTGRTKLIVITNLHNPSSVLTDEDALRRLGEIARGVGAHVLVDEVYLECLYEASRSAFHLGKEFVVTSSLTKAYGLGGLRCGWILAQPELAERMWRIKDLIDPLAAYPAEQLSVIALRQLHKIATSAKALLDANRPLLNRFLDSRQDLEAIRPGFGTAVFPHLKYGDMERLLGLLRDRYETDVAPGRFFEMPDHFRVGITGDPESLSAGLERLGAALDELNAG